MQEHGRFSTALKSRSGLNYIWLANMGSALSGIAA